MYFHEKTFGRICCPRRYPKHFTFGRFCSRIVKRTEKERLKSKDQREKIKEVKIKEKDKDADGTAAPEAKWEPWKKIKQECSAMQC